MGVGDTRQPSYPNNTHRQDWAFYPFVGGRGGASGTATGVTRYSFWIDFDPFDIKNLKMLSQNVSFQIFADPILTSPVIPHYVIAQSNDITDELIKANLPSTPGASTTVLGSTICYPPQGYTDDGSFFSNNYPPPVSGTPPAPTGLTAATTVGGGLIAGQTYYYCITAVDNSFNESVKSSVVSAVPVGENLNIGLSWNQQSGILYFNVYRNTVNDFTSTGGSVLVAAAYPGQPPYYNNTIFTSQPASGQWQNDQGYYTLQGNQNHGWGFGSTTMLAQGFVPQQPTLTSIFIGQLFHTNTNDPTTFYPLNIELWSSSQQFIQHLGQIQPIVNPSLVSNGVTGDASAYIICNNYSYNTGTDGNTYWITLNQPTLKFYNPVSVTPGQTYYLVFRQATLSASQYYFVGTNTDAAGVRSMYYYYPFANAYQATDGSSSGWSHMVDNNGASVTLPFLTQGSIGRYAVTYWWGDLGTTYWFGVPDSKEYVFLHVDYNARI